MKERSSKNLNVLLAAALFFMLAGFLLLVCFSDEAGSFAANFWPILILTAGSVFVYVSIAFTGSGFLLFMGAVMVLSGGFSSLVVNHVIPYSLAEWWPMAVVFSGVSLAGSGYYKKRRFIIAYTIPSVMITALGLFFLLFSFKVIHVPFRRFAALTGPWFILAGLILLVFFFFFQKQNRRIAAKKNALSDENPEDDGEDLFSDPYTGDRK